MLIGVLEVSRRVTANVDTVVYMVCQLQFLGHQEDHDVSDTYRYVIHCSEEARAHVMCLTFVLS